MNEYDNLTVTGNIHIPEVTRTISKLEKDVLNLHAMVTTLQGDTLALRAQLAHEMALGLLLREYTEYLNPAEGERPPNPMSYADWLKLQTVSEQIIAARAAA